MSDATTEVKDAATTVTTPLETPAQEDTTSFAERYSDVLGKVNDTLDQVDWSQMGRIGKIVGIFAAVIIAPDPDQGNPRHDQSAADRSGPAGTARRGRGGPMELEEPHHQRQAQCTGSACSNTPQGVPGLILKAVEPAL